jgi:DNA-directed RNA polymerase subunit RPC12/RpoP
MTEILSSNQMGLLPDTQIHVESDIRKEKLTVETSKHMRDIKTLQQQILRLKMTVQANTFLLRGEPVPERYRHYVQHHALEVDTRRKFIMACPMELCRGFLSTQYKCGTCQQQICSDCLSLKQDGHECVENDRLSAEMIKRETKPCPKCGTRIHKIDGCDQMYCTNQQEGVYCNTAFSWRTGQLATGTIHNPHFYELQQKQGIQMRNVGDIQCGGVPRIQNALRVLQFVSDYNILKTETAEFAEGPCPGEGWAYVRGKKGDGWYRTKVIEYDPELRGVLVRTHRRISEMVQYTATDYRERVRGHEGQLLNLRVRYMRQRISKEEFSDLVYKEESLQLKRVDIQQIMELLSISGIETFVDMMAIPPEAIWLAEVCQNDNTEMLTEMMARIKDKLDQLSIIREYCNEQFKQVSITYNCRVPEYDAVFQEKYVRYNMNGEKKK